MYELLKDLDQALKTSIKLQKKAGNSIEVEAKLKAATYEIENLIINLQRRSDPNTRTETTEL